MKTFKTFLGTNKELVLNPVLFNENERLHDSVKQTLFSAAEDFIETLGLDVDMVDDLVLIGANANYCFNKKSDLDISIILKRNLNLDKEVVRKLGIAASELNYKTSPSINGVVPLNFYITCRNVGSLRPNTEGIYKLSTGSWIKKPTRHEELSANHISAKVNYFCELIEAMVLDSQPGSKRASRLLNKLKTYRESALASQSEDKQSTAGVVFEMLKRCDYIQSLGHYLERLIKDGEIAFSNAEYAAIGQDALKVPVSIRAWDKKIRNGEIPKAMLDNVVPVLNYILNDK